MQLILAAAIGRVERQRDIAAIQLAGEIVLEARPLLPGRLPVIWLLGRKNFAAFDAGDPLGRNGKDMARPNRQDRVTGDAVIQLDNFRAGKRQADFRRRNTDAMDNPP